MAPKKAAVGNIAKGDSLYHRGHGETAPLTGLIFLPDLGRFGTPEAASFVTCIGSARGKGDATLGSSRQGFKNRDVLMTPSVPPKPKCDGFTDADRGATRLCDCLHEITPVWLRRRSLGSALIGATKSDRFEDNLGAGDLKLTASEIAARDAATSAARVYLNCSSMDLSTMQTRSHGEHPLIVDRLIDRGPEVEIDA
jgi:hypothetical protein